MRQNTEQDTGRKAYRGSRHSTLPDEPPENTCGVYEGWLLKGGGFFPQEEIITPGVVDWGLDCTAGEALNTARAVLSRTVGADLAEKHSAAFADEIVPLMDRGGDFFSVPPLHVEGVDVDWCLSEDELRKWVEVREARELVEGYNGIQFEEDC